MRIQLNGKAYDSSDGMTIAQLLNHLGVEGDRVAVELNLDIISKQEYSKVALKEGDNVEVVHFVGGGAGEGDSKL
jgi:sulfur carrier protein